METWIRSLVLALLAAGAAVACTVEGGEEGEPGGSCSVQELEEGKSLLLCDDGTSTIISTSIDSEEGSSCTVSDNGDGTKTLSCDDGTEVTIADGENGEAGPAGDDCTVNNLGGATQISCEDGSSSMVPHGQSCTAKDNEDGTMTLSCEDGSAVTIRDDTHCEYTTFGSTTILSCPDHTDRWIVVPWLETDSDYLSASPGSAVNVFSDEAVTTPSGFGSCQVTATASWGQTDVTDDWAELVIIYKTDSSATVLNFGEWARVDNANGYAETISSTATIDLESWYGSYYFGCRLGSGSGYQNVGSDVSRVVSWVCYDDA